MILVVTAKPVEKSADNTKELIEVTTPEENSTKNITVTMENIGKLIDEHLEKNMTKMLKKFTGTFVAENVYNYFFKFDKNDNQK